MEDDSRVLYDLKNDAEEVRDDLHKEIKDYRIMKKKLKTVILSFRDRLEELRHHDVTRELQD